MGRVEGKVAIVTGAASNPGLGRACAQTLAREGAKLVISDIDDEGGRECEQTIRDAGGDAVYLHHDVAIEDDWIAAVKLAVDTYGKVDVLVNNAGIEVLKPIDDMSLADFELQNRVNLTGSFLGIKYVIPEMRKAGGGSIINFSSVAGLVGLSGCIAYAASKGGVRMMSKVVAIECADDGIRCNSIHPGVIWTNMQRRATGQHDPEDAPLLSRVPGGKAGEPQDIADAVLYLSSDESKYVSGTEIVVDAGFVST